MLSVAAQVGLVLLTIPRVEGPPANFPDETVSPRASILCIDSPVLRRTVTFSPGGKTLSVVRHERASAQDAWTREGRTYGASYFITDVSQRRAGETLFVAGVKPNGATIIERWEFPPTVNRYSASYVDPAPLIGTPVSDPYRPTVSISGGTWAYGRGALPAAQKTVIYEGTAGVFSRVVADPEGRFLLLYDYDSESICQMVLGSGPPTFQVLYTSADHPQLDQLHDFEPRDSPTFGRTVVIWREYPHRNAAGDETFTLIFDADNDGTFESIESYSLSQYKLTAYWGASDWIFLNQS